MQTRWFFLSGCILLGVMCSFAQQPDTSYVQIPEGVEIYDTTVESIPRYNPLKAVGLSAALPGAGQIYTTAWIRGGAFLSAELIAVLVMMDRLNSWERQNQRVDIAQDSVRILRDRLQEANDSLTRQLLGRDLQQARDDRLLTRYERKQARYAAYHSIGWASGIYVWNLMDALGASNYFKSSEPKNPAVAGWLSAVPGLGLGQLYNEALSKAGMIWTIQTMLGVMSYNYDRLMESAADRRRLYVPEDPALAQIWQGRYNDAFTRRNMYLWYSVFFYFYGIFDAIVDAHLHDYPRKIRFEPVIESSGEKLGFQTVIRF